MEVTNMDTLLTLVLVAMVVAASFYISLVAVRLGLRLLLRAMVVGRSVVGTGKA